MKIVYMSLNIMLLLEYWLLLRSALLVGSFECRYYAVRFLVATTQCASWLLRFLVAALLGRFHWNLTSR